jgi:hypothetical protein
MPCAIGSGINTSRLAFTGQSRLVDASHHVGEKLIRMTPVTRPLRPNTEAQRHVALSTIRDLDVQSFGILSVDDLRPPGAGKIHPLDPARQQSQFAAEGSNPHLRTGHWAEHCGVNVAAGRRESDVPLRIRLTLHIRERAFRDGGRPFPRNNPL